LTLQLKHSPSLDLSVLFRSTTLSVDLAASSLLDFSFSALGSSFVLPAGAFVEPGALFFPPVEAEAASCFTARRSPAAGGSSSFFAALLVDFNSTLTSLAVLDFGGADSRRLLSLTASVVREVGLGAVFGASETETAVLVARPLGDEAGSPISLMLIGSISSSLSSA
jgi:hypothetical protein